MPLLIDNQQNKFPVSVMQMRNTAQAVLQAAGHPETTFSLLIVDDAGLAGINRRCSRRSASSKVVAFRSTGNDRDYMLGDVVLSLESCARQAAYNAKATEAVVRESLVHGVLSVLGYGAEAVETVRDELETLTVE